MALISSIEVSFDTLEFNTTKEPLGTEHESEVSLPSRRQCFCNCCSCTSLSNNHLRLQLYHDAFLCMLSTRFWSLVYECIVSRCPFTTPKVSSTVSIWVMHLLYKRLLRKCPFRQVVFVLVYPWTIFGTPFPSVPYASSLKFKCLSLFSGKAPVFND
jgi:hypothetical protein